MSVSEKNNSAQNVEDGYDCREFIAWNRVAKDHYLYPFLTLAAQLTSQVGIMPPGLSK